MAQSRRKSQPAQSGSGLKAFYIALGVIALGGVGWVAMSMSDGGASTSVAGTTLTGLEDPQALLAVAKGVDLGQPDAPVQVIVFSDFTCPACRVFNQGVEPSLKSELVQDGKVRFTYYDYVLDIQATGQHRHGFVAARAARCANDQQKFWEFHDVLFARQPEWSIGGSPPVDQFIEYGSAVGIEPGAFRTCIESDQYAETVSANRMLGDNLGVRGTPTVYVNGRALAAWNSYDALKAAVESEIAGR